MPNIAVSGEVRPCERERQADQRPGPYRGARCRRRLGQQVGQPLPPFAQVRTLMPVPHERPRQPQPLLRVPHIERPAQPLADIGALGVQSVEPGRLLRAEQGRLRLLRHRAIVAGVPQIQLLSLASGQEPFAPILAQHLQQSVARERPLVLLNRYQRPLHFTTLDTHDGIGVVEVQDLLTGDEIEETKHCVFARGTNVKHSYSTTAYENLDIYQLNSTYY